MKIKKTSLDCPKLLKRCLLKNLQNETDCRVTSSAISTTAPECISRVSHTQPGSQLTDTATVQWLKGINLQLALQDLKTTVFKMCLNQGCDTVWEDGL